MIADWRGGVGSLVLAMLAVLPAAAQQPLAPIRESGQTVTPVFEGWYRNPDGSYSLSFGYFNRNAEEIIHLPVGPENFFVPGAMNRGQPTHFLPRRHWGVFAVVVPADFGTGRIHWTLVVRGDTLSVPGSLKLGWEIDALEGEAGSGNTPPVLRFEPDGPAGSGPGGITAGPLRAKVGRPLDVTVWVTDDGRAASSIAADRAAGPVSLHWFTHQGPGPVTFSNPTPAPSAEGRAATTVTFLVPGEYVLRLRANDVSGVVSGGHAQCCWTNGFLKVSVTP